MTRTNSPRSSFAARRRAMVLASVSALTTFSSAMAVQNSFFPGVTFTAGPNFLDPANWTLGHVPNNASEEIVLPPGGPAANAVTMSFDGGNVVGSALTVLGNPGRVLNNASGTASNLTLAGLAGQPTILNKPTGAFQLTIGTQTTGNNINIILGSTTNEFRNSVNNVFRVYANIGETTAGTNVSLTAPLGVGTFVLGGSNSFSGALSVSGVQGGTIMFDYTIKNAPIVASTGSLIFNGGTIAATGSSLGTTQTVAMTTFNAGSTQFIFNGNNALTASTMDLGALARNPGGVANLVPAPLLGVLPNFKTSTANTNGILGGWLVTQVGSGATVPNNNVYDWAMRDGSGNIVPFINYNTKNDVSTWSTNDNINIDNSTVTGTVGPLTINSLRTSLGVAGAFTVNTTGLLTIASGGILMQGASVTSMTFAGTGAITSGTTDLIITMPSGTGAKTLTISTIAIQDRVDPDTTVHPVGITKSAGGILVITGAHSYTGDVHINNGSINIDGPADTGTPSGLGTTGTIYIGSSGSSGTLNFGAAAASVVVGSTNRDIVLGANRGNIRNQGPDGTVTLTGSITGGSLGRYGTMGWLKIPGSKTYTGSVTIAAGTLEVDTIAPTGTASGLGTGVNGGTIILGEGNASCLEYSGTVDATTDRAFSVENNTAIIKVQKESDLTNLKNLTLTGPITNTPAASTFSLSKFGVGTLTISGAKTFTGPFTIQRGPLSVDVIANQGTASSVGTGAAGPTITVGNSNSGLLSYTGISATTNRPIVGSPGAAGTGAIEVTVGALELTGGVTMNSGTFAFDGAGTVNVNSVVAGPAQLARNGTGTLILSSVSNSYTGNTNINSGTVVVSDSGNLGAATNSVTFNGGVLLTGASISNARPVVVNAGGGTVFTNGFNSTFTGPITGAGNLTKGGVGVLTTNGVKSAGLVVNTGTVAVAAGRDTVNKLSNIATLTIGMGAAVDLDANDMVIDYANGGAGDPGRLAAVQQQLATGFAGAAWNGTGLTSSAAKAIAATVGNFHKTALGYAEASTTGLASFDGVTTDGDMILVRYTFSGDANLDGNVNGLDFNQLSGSFGQSAKNWVNGDFNYDGVVNGLDFNSIATNFGSVLPASLPGSSALATLVPEPGSFAVMFGLAGLCARRRRS